MTDNDITDYESDIESFTGYVEQSSDWAENVFLLLFELKRKYGKSIKEKKVVNINESETDRSKVSDAYLYLQSEQENLLDSTLYEDFIKMSDLREESLLDQLLYPQQRLERFADIIRRCSTPLVYFSRLSDVSVVNLFQDLNEAIIEIDSTEELDLFIRKYQKYFTKLNSNFLDKGDILNIEETIRQKLIDKKIQRKDLNQLLSSLEAEILSKMISEKKIVVIQEGDVLVFSSADKIEDLDTLSSSLLLSPKLKNDESEMNG